MPKRVRRPGRSLEVLVAAIERALGDQDAVRVESPAYLIDKLTRERREHDVLLTVSSGHHSLQIAVECRDRSRKITVNDVEGFWSKCQDTGVHHGIIVSARGFSRTAHRKAEHRGFRCLRLDQAASFDWCLARGMHTLLRKGGHTQWTISLDEADPPPTLPSDFALFNAEGTEITPKMLENTIATALNSPSLNAEPGNHQQRFIIRDPDLVLRDRVTGLTHKVARMLAVVQYEVVAGFVPFQLASYRESATGEAITDAAIADLELGPVRGKLVIAYKEGEGGQVVFVRDRGGA